MSSQDGPVAVVSSGVSARLPGNQLVKVVTVPSRHQLGQGESESEVPGSSFACSGAGGGGGGGRDGAG